MNVQMKVREPSDVFTKERNNFLKVLKIFSFFANNYERSFAFTRERSFTITNDYEWSWTFANELKVHEGSYYDNF